MVVSVIGLGFVGLTAALGFCAVGHDVIAVESNDARRSQIEGGVVPFFEPGMQELLDEHLGKRLSIRACQGEEVAKSDAVFYCVGTPCGEEGQADLFSLLGAIAETITYLHESNSPVLVIKSTVPPGTLRDRVGPYVEAHAPQGVLLANNPEFLREGKSLEDFMDPDRIVVGASDERVFDVMRRLYGVFGAPLRCVEPTTAEFIKYLSNTLLATMISFSNEMANAAEAIGDIDVASAFTILQEDRRWTSGQMRSYVYPGCGYGGYCLPKDTAALQYRAHEAGVDTPILNAVIRTNEQVADRAKMRILAGGMVRSVGILGLAFKPETDDVRDTPAAKIINSLLSAGVERIVAFDPMAETAFRQAYPQLPVVFASSAEEVVASTERQAIVTAWDEFRGLARRDTVIDCRYMAPTIDTVFQD